MSFNSAHPISRQPIGPPRNACQTMLLYCFRSMKNIAWNGLNFVPTNPDLQTFWTEHILELTICIFHDCLDPKFLNFQSPTELADTRFLDFPIPRFPHGRPGRGEGRGAGGGRMDGRADGQAGGRADSRTAPQYGLWNATSRIWSAHIQTRF